MIIVIHIYLQYYRDDKLNDHIVLSASFMFKINVTEKTPTAGNKKDVNF